MKVFFHRSLQRLSKSITVATVNTVDRYLLMDLNASRLNDAGSAKVNMRVQLRQSVGYVHRLYE